MKISILSLLSCLGYLQKISRAPDRSSSWELRDERKSLGLGLRANHQCKVSKEHNYSEKDDKPHESSFKTIRRPASFMSLLLSLTRLRVVFPPSRESHGLSTAEGFLFLFFASAMCVTSDPGANHIFPP